MIQNFEDISPYIDSEVNEGLKRITANPLFKQICTWLFPNKEFSDFIDEFNNINSSLNFQKKFMYPAINSILNKTSDGLSFSGFENILKDKRYTYISNHRDILLDSAILQILLVDHGHETSEISFGSNLMFSQLIIDAGKVNRMFKVERSINSKEALLESKRLSEYIFHTLYNTKRSIWIAQRKGRTKNGTDSTSAVILKMLEMSSSTSALSHLSALNIIPVAISYEYEPCDIYKALELFKSKSGTYQKAENEDLNSIIKGITEYKGRVHLSISKNISENISNISHNLNKNEQIAQVAKIIDYNIISNYKLWPTNYIAVDLLNNSSIYNEYYTNQEKSKFIEHKKNRLKQVNFENKELETIFLEIYANPVYNFLINQNLS